MTDNEQLSEVSAKFEELAEKTGKEVEELKEKLAEAFERFCEAFSDICDWYADLEIIFVERERIRPSYKTPVHPLSVRRPCPLWRKNRAVFRPYKVKSKNFGI